MLEILKYIFSDFWIWLGAIILIGSLSIGISRIINAMLGGDHMVINNIPTEKVNKL